jgi:hypothetical protein
MAAEDALVLEPHQMKVAPTGTPEPTDAQGPEAIAATLKQVAAEASGSKIKGVRADSDQKRTTEDVSVDRLLAQTNSELENNEGSRRRSAIAHLKAAVAAVRADGGRSAKDTRIDNEKALGKYRSDLAQAVRPEAGAPKLEQPAVKTSDEAAPKAETPDAAGPEAETKVTSPTHPAPAAAGIDRPKRRMPPLMLVSEQRIDKPDASEAGAALVRPRRVHTDDLDGEAEDGLFDDVSGNADTVGNLFSESEDFKKFVADSGAEGMQELLEASAAFGSQVEGEADNSRPQILRRVIQIMPEGTYSREDGLRAFGVLLREGRIQRVDRGRFTIGTSSRFNPPRKSAVN